MLREGQISVKRFKRGLAILLSAGMIGGKDNGNAEDNTTIPASNADHAKSDAWNPAIIIIIGICILLIVSGAVIFVRKKSGSEEE